MTIRYENIRAALVDEGVKKQLAPRLSWKTAIKNFKLITLIACATFLLNLLAILIMLFMSLFGISAIPISIFIPGFLVTASALIISRPNKKLYKESFLREMSAIGTTHYKEYKDKITDVLQAHRANNFKAVELLQKEASDIIEKNRLRGFGESRIESILLWNPIALLIAILVGEKTIAHFDTLVVLLIFILIISALVFLYRFATYKLIDKTEVDQQVFDLLQEAKYILCENDNLSH